MAEKVRFLREKIAIAKSALHLSEVVDLYRALFPEVECKTASELDKLKLRLTPYAIYPRDELQKLRDALYKSHAGIPARAEAICERLYWALDMRPPLSKTKLMICTPREFFLALPPDRQELVEDIAEGDVAEWVKKIKKPAHRPEFGSGLHTVHVDIDHQHYDIRSAIDHRHLDQKYLYFDYQSAQNWKKLTKAYNRYPTFRYCLETLSDFVSSRWFSQAVTSGRISSVVMLGAGSPQKDMVILDRFAQSHSYNDKHPLNYVIVDTSAHMILETVKELRAFGGDRYKRFVNMVTVQADFMKLQHIQDRLADQGVSLRNGDENIVFFIPGGTISNVDEEHFMKSVRAVSVRGDLLVVGVEFIDLTDSEKYMTRLKAKYDHAELRGLVIPPVFWMLSDKEKGEVIAERGQSFIGVDVLEKEGPSSLKHLVTVSITAKIEDQSVTLATANRYRKDEFISFVAQYGFQPLEPWFPHRDEPQYNQAVFVRT